MKKNPWLAAILNLLLYGVGYIYNGERKGLGIALTAAWVVLRTADIRFFLSGGAQCNWLILMVGLAILQFTFAIDAFFEAKSISAKVS